ncbi:MAG: lysine--tRNA ligase [Patescibacteria group bacterium]
MEELDLRSARIEKLKKLKALGIDPYPASYQKKQTIVEALKSEGKIVKTSGRIFSLRTHGNIAFADLKDETGKIQIFFQKKLLGDEQYKVINLLDIGDFIGVEGKVVKTIAGEISIAPTSFVLLTKSILPLPSEWFGLKDTEARYRKRYLDLLLNLEIRKRFNIRTKLVSGIREYLDKIGFWEVETPTLQPLYGGANAKPFKTHVNALDQDVYLRIADELYLKRLIVGGYEKVYEICKDFRNEGIDHAHFPEFTMIEWYEAYADYQRVMDVAEGLFKHLAKKIYGHTVLDVKNKKTDIGNKWPRIEMSVILKEKLGLDIGKETEESLIRYAKEKCPDIQLAGGETKGQLIFAIFEHKIPKLLHEPTWIIDYPEDVSPLSKSHRSKKGWVERFEGYIGGKEICDGWSELTDPQIQRDRFTRDTKIARTDKETAQQIDEDFLTAMEYGVPPLGGIGIGIDRLTMFFTNTWAIKEVILFPTLRTELNMKQQSSLLKKALKKDREKGLDSISKQVKMTRKEAYSLLTKYISSKNLIKHCLACEATMKGIYKHLHANDFSETSEKQWVITGLLHDIDYELAQKEKKLDRHGLLIFEKDPNIIPEPIAHAIKAHNYSNTRVEPVTDMDWAISCCDQLTGIIVAAALIHKDRKLGSIDTKFVMKRFNTPSFARGANRETIKLCEKKLGIPLTQFVEITLTSMQGISQELGL